MHKVMNVIKGAIIGIANIIPGVSGGTLMVIFSVYERILKAIDIFFKTPIKAIISIWDILVGILLGLLAGVLFISHGYKAFPLATTLLFIGLLLGGLKPIYKKLQSEKNLLHLLILSLSFLIIAMLPLANKLTGIYEGVFYYVILLALGILSAFTMVAPGISGALVLLILGYYQHIIDLVKSLMDALFKFELNTFFNHLPALLILILGFIVGIILSAKFIKKILEKHEVPFYYSVFGMLLGAPIAIMLMLNKQTPLETFYPLEWVMGLLVLVIGFIISYGVIYLSENEESKRGINENESITTGDDEASNNQVKQED